jgi:chromodomain-helicase-DNA-binding protein 4
MIPVQLTRLQKELYRNVLQGNATILKSVGAGNRSEARVSSLQNVLMELRKICGHPFTLVDFIKKIPEETLSDHSILVASSGKLNLLQMMLPKLLSKGHKVLIFSQFKLMLNVIEDFLHGENIESYRMDGDTPVGDRLTLMDQFNQNDAIKVFLLTTRTGGLGINLTSADTIIIFDADWNPHQDIQAMARASIGQKEAGFGSTDCRKYGFSTFKQDRAQFYHSIWSRAVVCYDRRDSI